MRKRERVKEGKDRMRSIKKGREGKGMREWE
jgi:hypothetical protein